MSFYREPNSEPIPGYRLIEPLGSGGFGEAWKCEAPGGLCKAIKFVYGNLNSLDLDAARAEQELKALNRVREVRHPFVLSMDRIEVVDGELVIVMELADRNLHDVFEECRSAGMVGIPRDQMLLYIRDAAEALDHMNERHNLQHLDIKPRNLFVVAGRVKVADFGLVKHLERSGMSGLLGGVTPLYASPETFTGSISERSDQYSLAIVYQEMLTGQRPFQGKNVRQLAQQHLNEAPDLRALPEDDRPILARALAKNSEDRYPTCLAFVRALYNASVERKRHSAPPELIEGPAGLLGTMENILLEQSHPGSPQDLRGPVSESSLGISGCALSGEEEGASQLGITVAQPETGTLRPTIVLGLGGFGHRALLELRCRFMDRFGDLAKIPMIRFLAVDPDPAVMKGGQAASQTLWQGLQASSDTLATSDLERDTYLHPEAALRPSEIYYLPLHPVSSYRRRSLDQLAEWLPREKLFAMPRSLKTQGSRALGRLAFVTNYHAFMARLRREIQQACHPDALYQSVSQTGLALRDNIPRIYVLGAAGGGSSGMLIDLGYALRRLLRSLRQPDAPVQAFLYCGSPEDPATPRLEQSNFYATITELNHFSDPYTSFSAQYGSDSPRQVDDGPPFDSTYVLPVTHRTPEHRQQALAHLCNYLFHELATPLGLRLDNRRTLGTMSPLSSQLAGAARFRSLGTFSVWFPRGLLLRLAAQEICQRILLGWAREFEEDKSEDSSASFASDGPERKTDSGASPEVDYPADLTTDSWPLTPDLLDSAVARALADPDLVPETLMARLAELAGQQETEQTAITPLGSAGRVPGSVGTFPSAILTTHPRDALTKLLLQLEEQLQAGLSQDDPTGWARQAVKRVREWLGPGVDLRALTGQGTSFIHQRKSALTRSLEGACTTLAGQWDRRLYQASCALSEYPGSRLGVAEAALNRFIRYCDQALGTAQNRLKKQSQVTSRALRQLESALEGCTGETGGGLLSWLGQTTRRNLRVLMDRLAAYARQCLAEDLSAAVLLFFHTLRVRLSDRLRDLSLCRQRLRHLVELIVTEDDHEGRLEELQTFSWPRCSSTGDTPLGLSCPESFPLGGSLESEQRGASGDAVPPRTSAARFWRSIQGSGTTRVVLPEGREDLREAAGAFVSSLGVEQWALLDQGLGDKVLGPMGGLCQALLGHIDLARYIAAPLLNQGVELLSEHLPITDVAEVELSAILGSEVYSGGPIWQPPATLSVPGKDPHARPPDESGLLQRLAERLRNYHRAARPMVRPRWPVLPEHDPASANHPGDPSTAADAGKTAWVQAAVKANLIHPVSSSYLGNGGGEGTEGKDRELCYLLIPASEWGKRYGDNARQGLAHLELVNVPGQADLMLCREQGDLTVEDLDYLLDPCRTSYEETSVVPLSSPHARFDILDWTPLDP
jgi:serine/threonine protein kinase